MSHDPFWTLLIYLFLVLLIVAAMLVAPALLGERHRRKPLRRDERGTAMAYESGSLRPVTRSFVCRSSII